MALNVYFERSLASLSQDETIYIELLRGILKRNWQLLSEDEGLYATYVARHFSAEERAEKHVSLYLKSLDSQTVVPWLFPRNKCFAFEDEREQSVWQLGGIVRGVDVCRKEHTVATATDSKICVWSMIEEMGIDLYSCRSQMFGQKRRWGSNRYRHGRRHRANVERADRQTNWRTI